MRSAGGEIVNILTEIDDYNSGCNKETLNMIKAKIGEEPWKKVEAILDILETGESSIAHSKLILHICEDLVEKSSQTLMTRKI